MTDVTNEIVQAVSVLQACERYGISLSRNGFANCPFHSEKTPSLKVYDGNKGFYCFGCGKGGNVISFVMGYFNVDFKAAILKLNYDFSLNLPIERKMTLREKRHLDDKSRERNRREEEKKRIFKEKLDNYLDAHSHFIENDRTIRELKPQAPSDVLDVAFVKALHEREFILYELEKAENEIIELMKMCVAI